MGTQYDRLASTLFSKARRGVFGLLVAHPDEHYYLRQIVDLTGLAIGQVQREVNRLAQAGIIRRTARDRHVYFQANTSCPVFEELRRIVVKTVGGAEVLRRALRPLEKRIVTAFIFGSVARGEERQASDLDLMVIGDATFGQVAKAMRAAESELRREIHASVYPLAEFRRKLASRHHFISSVMKGEKVFIMGSEYELGTLLQ